MEFTTFDTHIKTTIKDLQEQRKSLHDKHWKEYTTWGNTERSQELFAEIQKIDFQIEQLKAVRSC